MNVRIYSNNNFRAASTISRLLATSFSGRSCGFPVGYGIASAPEIRAAPTVREIGVTVQIWAAGIPAFSICFTIVAPQRVQVPHVLVRITPSTPAFFSTAPISRPILVASATEVEFPVVVTR